MDMKELNRQPLTYITSNILDNELEIQLQNSKLKTIYTDVWMTMENLEEFKNHKSKIKFSVQKVGYSIENLNR